MRILLPLALLLLAPTVTGQTTFRLVDPLLSVDGHRLTTVGAPLVQQPFGILTISVPGDGTYTISERPFAGARRAGQFDGAGLYFAMGGRSVRLLSREPILSLSGPTTAYVTFEPLRSRSRGPARFAIADDVSGRGRRSTLPERASQRERASGPRPTLSSRPAAQYLQDTEVSRLRNELDRLVADRERLAVERDRLAGERDAALRAQALSASATQETAALNASLARLAGERDRLAQDAARLRAERGQLSEALAASQAERDRLAAEFGSVRQRAEQAEASAAGWARSREQVTPLQEELAQLRADLQARDRAIDLLRAEKADRAARLPAAESSLDAMQARLVTLEAERDRALADRDRAYRLRDDAVAALDQSVAETAALRAERDQLVVERDRLRVDRTTDVASPYASTEEIARERAALDAERAALARDRALLDADRAALAAERAVFESLRGDASMAPAPAAATLDDRGALLDQLAAAQSEREALATERDRLASELAALRTATSTPAAPAPVAPRPTPQTVRTPSLPSDGAVAFLPGFDFGRLGNPDVIRRRLDEAEYPRWATVGRIEGDVLVLFQTDRTGRVVTTAVPTPIGGGLDGLAEEIVREMRFAPSPDSPSGVRSQVVVRFEL